MVCDHVKITSDIKKCDHDRDNAIGCDTDQQCKPGKSIIFANFKMSMLIVLIILTYIFTIFKGQNK